MFHFNLEIYSGLNTDNHNLKYSLYFTGTKNSKNNLHLTSIGKIV